MKLVHNVLGTDYEILFGNRKMLKLKDEISGECRVFSKTIKVCTDDDDCTTDKELEVKVQEIIAHEIFHAYINESGINLEPEVEELIATFFMKNWRKMNNSILEVLDKTGLLDK